ncbi:UDP-glucoronosyl and UDP-glucosyl transferase domain-containing protein [Ditylenchus destructor]|uniref:glucuronosyltransferase n=1 Tax=Ditylenchus destructor TaxID=166010 RepID=A0AAD4MXV7_9BILA|nr:UDP-glucoronosyl and UDP-glucosyl transferase domain-containing protein [Ditylenchus destructor]
MNGPLIFVTKATIFGLTIATALLNLGILGSVDGLKVLVMAPNFGYSHLEFHGHLADLLVQRGHYVHFVTPEFDPTLKSNGTRLSQKVTRYFPQGEFRHKVEEMFSQTPLKKNPFEANIDFSNKKDVDLMKQMFGGHCFDLLSNKGFLDELRAEEFEVGIAEDVDICSFPLFHVLGIKTVFATSSTPLMAFIAAQLGLPSPPYVAEMNSAPVNSPHLSFFQRITNLLETYRSSTIWGPVQEYVLERARRIHPTVEIPSGSEIMRRTSFLFVNINEYLDISRPISSKIKFIGGIALKKPKELSSGISQIIDKAKKGVVIFSFGSLVDTDNIPKSVRDAFVHTFSQFPEYEFIWKMNGLNPNFTANLPENVHTMEWIDQPSLLAHPKTKAFITHCGLNSLNEAAYFGVPVIAIPMFGDQNYNTAIVQNKGIGVAMSRMDLTRESVGKALGDVLNKPSYSIKMKTLSRKLHRVPFKPAQVFIENVEFAAEFEGDFEELNLAGWELNFFQYFMLDFFIPLALFSIAVVAVTAKAILRILRWLREIRSKKID